MACSLPIVLMLYSHRSNDDVQVADHYGMYTTGAFLLTITLLQTCAQMILARPLLADISPPGFCARLVAYSICIEQMIGAVAPGIVATISEDMFGYSASRLEIVEMSAADRFGNAEALRKSFLVTQLVGTIGTMICFVLVNGTVRKDVESASRAISHSAIN